MRLVRVAAVATLVVSACGGDEPSPPSSVGEEALPTSTQPQAGVTQPSVTLPTTTRPRPPLPRPTSVTVTSTQTRPATTVPLTPTRPTTTVDIDLTTGTGPVVDLFYAIHVHTQNEWAPFVDPDLTNLDTAAAEGFVNHVEAIATVLEAHRARGSFHFTYGTAAGLCLHDPHLFDDLEVRGHEIGIHAHTNPFLLKAADVMRQSCAREIGTGSGLAAMAGGPQGSTRASLGTSLGVFQDAGASQLLVNVSDECGTATGGGNDITPWRADAADICAPGPTGIVMIDQVSLEYVLFGEHPADVFSHAEFSTLAGLAEAAVTEAGALPADSVAVWGFVTHTNEYVVGASALATPEPAALDGLDLLLRRLDQLVESGLARWSTAAEIAARVD